MPSGKANKNKVFTTWADLEAEMRNDLVNGSWRRFSSYSVAGRSIAYRSFEEFKKMLDFVSREAAKESGKPLYQARVPSYISRR